ncbi:MAG: hypothetical protein WCK65_13845 [Rhodospirillaceae bacterium]
MAEIVGAEGWPVGSGRFLIKFDVQINGGPFRLIQWGWRMRSLSRCIVLGVSLAVGGCAVPTDSTSSQGVGMDPTSLVSGKAVPSSLESMVLTKPKWNEGESWKYSDGYGMRVEEVGPKLTRFQRLDDSSQWYTSNGFFREKSQSASAFRQTVFRSENPERFFTAAPGESVVFVREYLRDKKMMRHQTSWVVESKETITVPAGTYDTFVIVMRTRSLTSNWTGFERWWYAPAVKNYVRMEYRYGQSPEGARVLVSYNNGG